VDDRGDPIAPDWEILACILRRLRRDIHLDMHDNDGLLWNIEAPTAFAGVIHGQAVITGFRTGEGSRFRCLDILCAALLTLPALQNISFDEFDGQGPEEGQFLESMTKLLQSPSLRVDTFRDVVFTNTLCQAIAEALKERSEITDLSFSRCFFPEGGGAVIASAVKTNTKLKHIDFDEGADEVFYEVLAAALLSNSTLQELQCSAPDSSGNCSWLSPSFLALQVNNGLKELSIWQINLIDEKLSTAIRLGLW
jgi:hypothetical protein